MAGIKPLNTCNACNFDNPGDSEKCNRCGKDFRGFALFGKGDWVSSAFTKRWQCHLCGAKNQWTNNTCHGCDFKSNHSTSSGCFITTATCISLNKGDNCSELNIFRYFRDSWLKENYKQQVVEYYEVAPQIVEKIEQELNSREIYQCIWEEHLAPCLELIAKGEYELTRIQYKAMVETLKTRFINKL